MRRYLKIFLIATLLSQAAWVLALDLVVPMEELSSYLPSTKCHLKWEDGGFDPLRIDFNRTKGKEVMSEEEKGCINTIKNVLREKKIEGIVFGRGALDSRVLIGDHVFSPADELGFVNDQGEWAPIYPGRSVILLEVTKEKGIFLVSGKDTRLGKYTASGTENKFEIIWEDFFQF